MSLEDRLSAINESARMKAKKAKKVESPKQRPHFKIEWRELSYYHGKQGSLLDRFLNRFGRQKNKTSAGNTKTGKRILDSLDGCFRSGELSAILGPSGAGKSTFLRTLFGDKQESSQGQTRVTWLSDNQQERRSIKIASLPQHDHLLNHLTVFESLMFASKIKNIETGFCHRQNVKRVAKMLNLTDCLDTRCGKLSGGQYKRVSIGQELLSEPDVIILDEPTSGLDALTCLTTVQTLKSIACKHPISIILTIHQPDIDVFNLFDHVYVIAQGGVAIYEGPPRGIVGALEAVHLRTPSAEYNPARFIVEHAFLDDPPDLAEAQQVSVDPAAGSHSCSSSESSDDEDDDEDAGESAGKGYLRRSVLSLSEIVSGKEMASDQRAANKRDKKPLLNIGIQTLDGKLITSEQLDRTRQEQRRSARLDLLKRLNQNQKAPYKGRPLFGPNPRSDSNLSANVPAEQASDDNSPTSGRSLQMIDTEDSVSVSFSAESDQETRGLRRHFDKRLSAKHNCSKQRGQPVCYHTLLLAHRTWLSIVRDPIFFGIQACMHTIIPVLLALIFGSAQEEGCPRVGNFDLVEFAYSESSNMIQSTVTSIRQSIGNIGIVFFEMFVLSFSINCITALVFPLDMYVLLKEYRNGWYSLRSYLFGRTFADLPVPVALHSLAMAILCYLTGQPLGLARFGAIVALVITASLVAQSVGLTIGALLMKSSQSAVLAAAGVVAPFFALSGFIVRIHTLPLVAQTAAKLSYLYHLLNGFIILRYGFDRCPCHADDFEQNKAHQIPSNLHTMASMWIGTYSNEYETTTSAMSTNNRTNVDPNIDVVDKMLQAFKMANSYGHQISNCSDVVPYAMLDFNLRDQDIYTCFLVLITMLIVSRFVTFCAIYYKVRSYT